MTSFFRVLKFALQKFLRNSWLSFVTITVLVFALLSVNFIIITDYFAQTTLQNIEQRIDLSVYFKQGVADTEIRNVQRFLSSLETIVAVDYVSPQQALESFKERYKDSDEIMGSLNELDENPLPASLIIRTDSVENYQLVLDILSDDVYQDIIASTTFKDYETLITRANTLMNQFRYFGYALSAIFLLMAILIIYNTVRINVYSYREEIGIMKLVGATNTFVRAPFIVESILAGLLAVSVVAILMYTFLQFVTPYLLTFFGSEFDLLRYFQDNWFNIWGAQILGIVILNFLASRFAVGRYLKV